eukprot:scaffold7641_cov115-Cylindrotheca_fusiformis.AAC.16
MLAAKGAVKALTRNPTISAVSFRGASTPAASVAWSNVANSFPSTSSDQANSKPFTLHLVRDFSTTGTRAMGSVTRNLKALDDKAVAKIQDELNSVDTNEDGRLDADELSALLKKHNSAFTDDEILEARELFYAGRSGGSLTFEDFIEVLDRIEAKTEANHPILNGNCSAEYIYRKSHAKYTPEELDIKLTHTPPQNMRDRMAYGAVKGVRLFFDTLTGWNNKKITIDKVMNRVIFLETIAAVPGFIAAIVRHFKSLRRMERDGGLLHLFLEEANNERMHLLSFIKMKNPGSIFRASVILSQFGFGSAFLTCYAISPKFCHRFVGYVEEEACSTYTKIIEAIENAPEGDELAAWRTQVAPNIALGYWELGEHGTVLELMYAIRADEAEHRDVNHATSELALGQTNPYNDPEMKVSLILQKYVKDIMSREDKLTPA